MKERILQFARRFLNQYRNQPNPFWIRPRPVPGSTFVTPVSALTYSAVFACMRVIAETLAMLQWQVIERRSDGTSYNRPDHPVAYLLNVRPNSDVSAMVFREQIVMQMLSWGNAYAEIQLGNGGYPVALWQIPSERVYVRRDESSGELLYDVTSDRGGYRTLRADQILHWRNVGVDGVMGLSTVALAANTISFGMEMDAFGAHYYQNAPFLSGWMEFPGKLPDRQRTDAMSKSFREKYAGWGKAGEIAILEGGMQFKQLSMPMRDAEFLSSRTFQLQEVCRWFRVPQHKIGVLEEASYSNIEALEIDCFNETFLPTCTRLEQEIDYKVLSGAVRASKFSSKHVLTPILKGDLKTRAEAYAVGLRYGWWSINEVRQMEDLNVIPGGDLRTVQLNTVPLEQFAALADVKLEQAKLDAAYREQQIEQLELANDAGEQAMNEPDPADAPDAVNGEPSDAGGAQPFEPSQAAGGAEDDTRAATQVNRLAEHRATLLEISRRRDGTSPHGAGGPRSNTPLAGNTEHGTHYNHDKPKPPVSRASIRQRSG